MADIAELGFRLDTRDLTRGKGALDELSRSAERTAASLAAMTVGVGSLSVAMYDTNRVLREFSREMAALGAVLGGTSDQMTQLREQAKVMGATTKFGAQQAAEAQKNLAQAGLSVQQIMAATPKVLSLATAGNLELAQSAEFLVDVMSQASLTVADFGRISDVAVKAANLSTTSVAQLSQGYKYAMANGALLGMSIEEVTSALAVLAQAGLKAEQGGTGLRGIASRFMQPSKEMTKTLKENSISVNDLNIAARGLEPVLDTIAKSTLSIPELMELFGQEASSAGLALVKNRQQFVDWANELKNANNTTDQVAKDMGNNLDAAFKSIRSAVEGAYIAISDATGYEKGLQNALNFSSGVINGLSGMNESAVKAGLMSKQMAADYKDAGETVKEVASVIAAVVVSKLAGSAVSALSSYTAATLATIAANRNAAIAALEKATADNAVAVGAARRASAEKDAAMVTLQRAQADVVAARNAIMAATTDAEKTIAAQRLAAAEYQRTEATGAAALASQKLSQSNATTAATTTALAAAQRTATATTTAAGVAARTFGGIVGALGGPIGIAITALIGLAFYWDEIKVKAFGAAESAESAANRIKTALASSNIAAANAGLDSLRASRSTIEKELGRVDAILKNESGLSSLDVSKLTQQRQQLSQESEKVRSEILKSEAEIRKAKEGQAKQAVELVNGYASPLEKRLGLIKTETQEIAKAMEFKPPASKPDAGDDKKKKDKEAAKAAKELAGEQAKLNDLLQKGEGFSATYAEKLALLAKYQSKIPVDEYRAAVEKLILTETEAGKTAAKHAEEVAKLQEQFASDDAKRNQDLQWQSEELALQASLIGKTSTEQAYLVAAFEAEKEIRSQIIDLTQEQAKYEREGNKWAVDAIDERIAKLQDEAQARKDAAGTLAAQKAVLSGWQSVSSDIERALTDSLMRGFENGENFVDSLKNYIENAFKSFAVKLLLQPIVAPINAIGGPIYSQMMGGQPQQGQGGSFDIGKMFSDSKSSYDSFIDTGLKSSVGQSLGFSTPLTYTDAWAAGQNVSGATVSAGAELTSLGEAASTAGQALGYLPVVMQAAEGQYISAVGSAVGQYFGGPIGSMTGAAIGGLLDDAFGFGEKKPDERRARFGYGASEALVSEGKQTGWTGQSSFGTFRTYADKWFSDSEMRPAMSAFVDSLENLDNTVADSLKLTADQTANAIDALKAIDKEYSFGLQWGDFTQNSKAREQIAIDRYSTILDSVESGWGDFVRGFTGSFDQFPAFLQSIIQAMQQFRDAGGDVTRVFGQQVNSIKEFERFAKSGETSAAAFQRLYGVFQITNRVLESLGKSTKGANLATADLRENFVRLAGGMEQLQGYLTEYYEGFYTEAERTAVVMADLQKEFDKYGATVPATREEWRKLMESLDLSTQAGQEAAAKLYQLQGAFLSVTPEIQSATEAAKDFKDEIADLEQYFRDQLNAVDYSGMTEQGQQAASALDELTSKLARLSEIGGDVDLGVQAIGRYIKTEIPKLYADALAPFKQAGGRGYTDLGKSIYAIFQQVAKSKQGISEVSSSEASAIDKAASIVYKFEERFAGLVETANGMMAISEHGTKLALQKDGSYATNADLADEIVSKYDATFGDIRNWFDEKAVFEQSAGKEALTEVFDQAQQTTTGQLSDIYEKITGKEAESLGKDLDQYAQDVNLSNKDLSDAIKESILSTDLLSKADPANELAKMAFGREATAEERQAVIDAYSRGVNNGGAPADIVADIVSHVSTLEEAQTHLGAAALEAAKDVGDFSQATKNYERLQDVDRQNYSVYDSAGIVSQGNAEIVPVISAEQKAKMEAESAAKKAAAMAELLSGMISIISTELESAFADVNKEASLIGLSEVGRAAKEAADTLAERMRSIVETVQLTAAGIAEAGGIDATSKAKELADAYAKGAIKTGEELKTAVDAVFDGVAGSDDLKKAILLAAESSKKLFDEAAKQLREQLVAPWQSAFDALAGNSIDAEINAAIKAKDQALADAKTLAESLGQNFDDLAKEIQRGFNAQLFGLTKQKLQGVIDSISKIADFQTGIDDAIFGLRVGMSGADVSGLYAQRQAEIKAQLDAAMQGDNLDEQIGLANKLRETITQRYAAEQQAQERMMSFARGLGDYLRQLRTSDKSTGSIYDRLTEAQKQFAEDVSLSRGTGAEAEAARGRITNTSDTLLDLARQFYASGEGYQQIYNSVVGGLEGLQIDTRTEAERQLDAINAGNDSALKQISELQALRGTFDSKLGVLQQQQATYVFEMQKLAGQLGLSQSAILQALKDLPSGIASLIASTAATGSNTQPKTTHPIGATSSEPAWLTNFRESTGIPVTVDAIRNAYASGGDAWLNAAAADMGVSALDVASVINGSHKDGLSHVPFDGYVAELHKGERVLTASENRDYSADVSRIMGGGYGGQSVAPLLNEIKALRQEVAQLRQQQSGEHQDDLRQREAIAKQSMGQTKDLQTAMIRNTALNI